MAAENKVLLVEDEASLKRSLIKYMERAGYSFECCSTARDALALAERLDPDIGVSPSRCEWLDTDRKADPDVT